MVCLSGTQPRVTNRVVAEPQADTPDATELSESYTVAHSLSKGTDERGQLELVARRVRDEKIKN